MIPTLRPDYQVPIVEQIIKAMKDGFRAPLVVSPTGSGKTIIFAYVAADANEHGKRVLVITHRREILKATVKKIFDFGIQSGLIQSGKPMTIDNIQVAMVSTLVHRLDQIIKPDIIVIDEAHHATAGQWMKIQKYFPNVFRIGFTATPTRMDGEGLISCFDTMIEGPTTRWMVENGWLARPRIFRGPNVTVKAKYKIKMGDYDKTEQFIEKKQRVYIGNVINHYREHLNGLPTICFCVSIEHCHMMEEEFNEAGFKAVTVKGDMPDDLRDQYINGLGTGEVQIVCSFDVISEGVDVPTLAGVILLRRMKSLGLFLQQVGRALRPVFCDGMPTDTIEQRISAQLASIKPYAIILDHAGCIYDFGHVLAEREWSLFSKKRSQRDKITPPDISVCPACGGSFEGNISICPECGFNIGDHKLKEAGKKTPEEIEGILKEVMDTDATIEEIAALKAQAERIQQMSPADRQRQMMYNLKRFGKNSNQIKGLVKIAGYPQGWTHTVYSKFRR